MSNRKDGYHEHRDSHVDVDLALVTGVSVETRVLINLRLSWARGEKFPDCSFFLTAFKSNSS